MLDLADIALALLADPRVATALRDALGAPAADELLTIEEAAALAKLDPRVIRDAGRIEGPRGLVLGSAGGSPRVRRSELDRWMALPPVKKPRQRRQDAPQALAANDVTDPRAAAAAAVQRTLAKMRAER